VNCGRATAKKTSEPVLQIRITVCRFGNISVPWLWRLRGGRIDTMTLSLGYELFGVDSSARQTSVIAGLAIRMVGNYEGERIQNGFHRR